MTQQPASQQNPFNAPGSQVQPPKRKNNGVAILVIVLGAGFFGIMVLGILAAIAIPNFLRFQSRARQSEAKTLLKAVYTKQQVFRAENDTYAASFEQLGWSPDPGRRYTYYMGGSRMNPDAGDASPSPVPPPAPSAEGFEVYAVGNIDSDNTLDVWSIDAANQLVNVTDDIHD